MYTVLLLYSSDYQPFITIFVVMCETRGNVHETALSLFAHIAYIIHNIQNSTWKPQIHNNIANVTSRLRI